MNSLVLREKHDNRSQKNRENRGLKYCEMGGGDNWNEVTGINNQWTMGVGVLGI